MLLVESGREGRGASLTPGSHAFVAVPDPVEQRRQFAHGSLVGGIISAALARLPGLIIYLSQDVSYLGPVPLGARVTAECEVVENIGKGRFRLSTTVMAGSGEDADTVIDGEAVVISDPIPDLD